MNRFWLRVVLLLAIGALSIPFARAERQSKVSETKHNLSTSSADGNTKSGTESQICVFCHTPHGANTTNVSPLWNRATSGATYNAYSSESLDARFVLASNWLGQPLGSSKLCLSCHDGTIALGNVVNAPGAGAGSAISVAGSTTTTMPAGTNTDGASPAQSGYTRLIGSDLRNDHPISITYDSTLAARDGELRVPNAQQQITGLAQNSNHPLVGPRAPGQGSGIGNSAASSGLYGTKSTRPVLPLENTTGAGSGTGQVQCTTCHDPHIKETDLTAEKNIKFLRRPRFQLDVATGNYQDGKDIICLACHDKGGESWARSAHANSQVAQQTYKDAAANLREFPLNIPVWKASCLNCHDTHTVSGARRLTRGGVLSGTSTPALEETCYQCHRSTGSILNSVTTVPDIWADFQLARKMPITAANEQTRHDIGGNFNDTYLGTGTSGSNCTGATNKCGADFVEAVEFLGPPPGHLSGKATNSNRHAECTDCHNPHRVVKNRLFYGSASGSYNITAPQSEGTHNHTDTAMLHTNVASGVLRGTWGVEPSYSSASFHSLASDFKVRRGDPGIDFVANDSTPDDKGFVTREYQVCLKCHSSYAYGSTPPDLGVSTPSGTNGLTKYTDQAKEFQAPDAHRGEPLSVGNAGGSVGYNANNHRSWHPVMRSTGRDAGSRDLNADNAFRLPFRNVGTQTMYCSDCHGSNTGGTTAIPAGTNQSAGEGSAWGPHGSGNDFILKGVWTGNTGHNTANALCLKCHNPISSTGFNGPVGNLHDEHQKRIGGTLQCTWCHIAVPHGWKNKALLVNLNDVGGEVPGYLATDSFEVAIQNSADNYTAPPYYLEAKNKIRSFAQSGSWVEGNCGSSNVAGKTIIANSQGGTSNRAGSGKNWMTAGVCNSGMP